MEENNTTAQQPHATPMTEEQRAKRKELAQFLNLTHYDDATFFFNMDYWNDQMDPISRTVLAIDHEGCHLRMKGQQSGKFHDEAMNVKIHKDIAYDVNISIRRACFHAVTNREFIPNDEQKEAGAKPSWEIIISHAAGTNSIPSLDEQSAIHLKQIIWAWANYSNVIIVQHVNPETNGEKKA